MSWECAGYGQAIYTNFVYPFKCDPPKIPAGCNHVGCYQTPLKIPAGWENRRVFISFEGVSAAFHCWIDGQFVGYSQDSFLPAEFDITRFVKVSPLPCTQVLPPRGTELARIWGVWSMRARDEVGVT